jgi:hypothetical protein
MAKQPEPQVKPETSMMLSLEVQHRGKAGRCTSCGELFPCSAFDRLLRDLHRQVVPEPEHARNGAGDGIRTHDLLLGRQPL